jgi:hypothetical protein
VLDIMAARGDLPALFTPQFMAGQQKKATTLYAALPKKSRAGIDLPKLLHQLNMQNLAMQNGGGFVLRRGKSGQAPGLKK